MTTTIPTPQALLTRAADIITERGWAQGDYISDTGCVCALGAIYLAAGEAAGIEVDLHELAISADLPVEVAMAARAAEDLAAERVVDQAPDGIAYYNDQHAASAAEVVAVLRAAAEGGVQ